MVEFDSLIQQIHKKTSASKNLSKTEMILLLINSILKQRYIEARLTVGYRRGVREPCEVNRILLIQLTSIGDVVYSTPVILGLREKFPRAKIFFLVEEAGAQVVAGNPMVSGVIIFKRGDYVKRLRRGGLREVCEELHQFVIQELERRKFDLVINLHISLQSAYLSYLCKAKSVSGLTVDDSGRPLIVGSLWGLYKYYVTCNQKMRDLNELSFPEIHIKMCEVNPSRKELVVVVSEEEERRASRILDSFGVKREDVLIGLNPGANYKVRRWEWRKFAELGDLLYKEYKAKIVIFGGARDEKLASQIEEKMHYKPINLAGKTTLAETTSLISKCHHFISGDTGPMHIAGAVKTKTIVIAGPTRTGPYGGEGHILLQADLPCVGCGPTSICSRVDCMKAIEPYMVMDALRFQRGEISHVPKFNGVKLYTSGWEAPDRLFSYYPLQKERGAKVRDRVLSIILLNLWINENNKLSGFHEEPILVEEAFRKLIKHFEVEDIREGVDEAIKFCREYEENCKRGIYLLDGILSSKGEERKRWITKFNQLNEEFYKGLGRFLSFYDFLFLELNKRDKLRARRRKELYKAKTCAVSYTHHYLEELRKVL